jgi:hypothetical protein
MYINGLEQMCKTTVTRNQTHASYHPIRVQEEYKVERYLSMDDVQYESDKTDMKGPYAD